MQPGDILLYKYEKKWSASWWIAWGTSSEYSHVAICVAPGMSLGIEAMIRKKIRAIDLNKIPGDIVDVYRVKEGQAYDLDQPQDRIQS